MERTSSALDLELARQHRGRADERLQPALHDVTGRDRTAVRNDDCAATSRVVELDAGQRDRERVLAPGAPGAQGAAYKLLRTQVLRRMDQLAVNTIAVLSPAAEDGKTLTALNLAIAIAAELDRTALLVDFDLRNPSVHRRLGFEPAAGVEDCLQSGRPVQEAMVRIAGYERLAILPARWPVANSSELLLSPRGTALFNEIKSRYVNRVIVFDLPPVLRADDALAFSRLVESGLMVVGEGRTAREDLLRTMSLLRELTLVGTVLNGSREPARPLY